MASLGEDDIVVTTTTVINKKYCSSVSKLSKNNIIIEEGDNAKPLVQSSDELILTVFTLHQAYGTRV